MKNTVKLVYCAVFTALVFVATAYLKVPLPLGYAHLGDGVIFIAVSVLGGLGALPAALGSALADLMLGYGIYVPASLIIKGAMALLALKLAKGRGIASLFFAFIACEALMVLGYYGYECILYGAGAAAAGLIPNAVQGLFGATVGTVLVRAMESAQRRLHRS